MTSEDLKTSIREVVIAARDLRDAHTDQYDASVNYAALFAQSDVQYQELYAAAKEIGQLLEDTPTGPLFHIESMETIAGPLQLLKIRKPDPKRSERGDADFTVQDYVTFKAQSLTQPGFTLIEREKLEMVELQDPGFNVLVYFSHPSLTKIYGLE